VLALFSRVLAPSRRIGRKHAHHRLLFLRCRRGQCGAARAARGVSCRRRAAVVFTLVRPRCWPRRFLRAVGARGKKTWRARVLLVGTDPRNDLVTGRSGNCPNRFAWRSTRLLGLFPACRWWCIRRRGHHGAMPARGAAHAHHALLARPARQRAAHEAHGRGAVIQRSQYKPWRWRGACARCWPMRSMRSRRKSRRGSCKREWCEDRVRCAGSAACAKEPPA